MRRARLGALLTFVVLAGCWRAEEEQARLLQAVEQQRTRLRRLNRTLARTQERERQELARET